MSDSRQTNFTNFNPQNFVKPQEFRILEIWKELEDLTAQIKDSIKPKKLFYTEREAAELLGVSVKSLSEERRKGKISHSRAVSKIFYLEKNIQEYLEATQISPNKRRK